jgi:hypothetical protein
MVIIFGLVDTIALKLRLYDSDDQVLFDKTVN